MARIKIKKYISPFADAPAKPGYTKEHTPLVWENMLGTVYGKRHGDYEAVYFDYDYEACHAHVGLDNYEDLRVCRVKTQYQGWPYAGKWALFGVRIVPQSELRAKVEHAERMVAEMPHAKFDPFRRRALKKLLDRQLKDFVK